MSHAHFFFQHDYLRLFQFLGFYNEQNCPNISYSKYLDNSHFYVFSLTVDLEQSEQNCDIIQFAKI